MGLSKDIPMLALNIALAGGIVVALASSSIVNFRDVPKPSIQPRSVAFSIWSLIFPLLFAMAVVADRPSVFPRVPTILTLTSVATILPWALVMRARAYFAAAGFLGACAIQAWVAHALTPKPVISDAWTWVVHAGGGLFAGWVTIASGINLAIASSDLDKTVLVSAVSGGAALASVITARPVPLLSILWGATLQEKYDAYIAVSVAVLVTGGILSTLRALKHDPFGISDVVVS